MNGRLLKTLLCCAMLFCLLTQSARGDDTAVISGSGVNMRSGPGTVYRIIDCLKKGTEVNVIGRDYDGWCLVECGGQTGYISDQYLSPPGWDVSGKEGVTFILVTPQPEAQTSSGTGFLIFDPNSGETITPAVPSAPIYPEYEIEVTPSPAPTPVPAPALYSFFPTPDPEGPVPVFPEVSPSAMPTLSPMPGFAPSGTESDSSGDAAQEPEEDISFTLNTDTLENAENSSPVPEDAVDLSSSDLFSFPGTPGYISGTKVRFRTGPSLGSSVISEFYYGSAVTIIGTTGDWTAVIANGESGYVYSRYVNEGAYSVVAEPAVEENHEDSIPQEIIGDAATEQIISVEEPVQVPEENLFGDETSVPSEEQEIQASPGTVVAAYACQFLGTPYCWGGTDPSTGFDCSGFVWYVYNAFGIELNRVAQDQALNGVQVDPTNLAPGDILCFYSGGTIGHSGIYLGDGKFIHSANSRTGVIIGNLTGSYSVGGFEARRIV